MRNEPTIVYARRARYPVHQIFVPFGLGLARFAAVFVFVALMLFGIIGLGLVDGARLVDQAVRHVPRVCQRLLFHLPLLDHVM